MNGTAITAKVLARGQVTLPSEARRQAGLMPGDLVTVRATGPGTLELRVLPRLTLQEMFDRYRIDGPIDVEADRQTWETEAAQEVFGASLSIWSETPRPRKLVYECR